MIPGKTRHLPEHVVGGAPESVHKVLKSAVIYGANASGKSNLIKSIDFAKKLIVKGTNADQEISNLPFRLSSRAVTEPSEFEFEFELSGVAYSYGFSVNSKWVLEEWLFDITTEVEKPLFERKTISEELIEVKFGISFNDASEKQFFQFVAKGTRPNQLFLTETKDRNIPYFKNIYDWFRDKITIIFPHSKPYGIEFQFNENKSLSDTYCEFLKIFDTGISGISTKEVDFEKDLTDIPNSVKKRIKEDLKGKKDRFVIGSQNKLYSVYRNSEGEIKSIHLMTKHFQRDSKEEVLFELSEESDGTQRLIDFIPALVEMLDEETVVFVDEIDRSLHPILVKSLLDFYFKLTKNKKSQLIITTHESSLLDLKSLRKDEIWFVEKNNGGASQIYSLEEFKPRFDKDVRKGYLLGRFGAIPVIKSKVNLDWLETQDA